MASNHRLTHARIDAALEAMRKKWSSDDEGIRNRGRLMARVCNRRTVLFHFRYSIGGKQRYLPLGPFSEQASDGFLTLEEARNAANRLSALYRAPETREVRSALARQSKEASPAQTSVVTPELSPDPAISLEALCTLYVEQLRKDRKPSWKDTEGLIRRAIAPSPLAGMPANAIQHEELVVVLEPFGERAPRQGGKLRSALCAAYQYAINARLSWRASREWKRIDIRTNPAKAIPSEHTVGTTKRAALDTWQRYLPAMADEQRQAYLDAAVPAV